MDIQEDIKKLITKKLRLLQDILREATLSGSLQEPSSFHETPLRHETPLDLPTDNQTVEQFRLDKAMSLGDKIQIVDVLNQLMSGRNVLILRDNGNDTWVCLHYRLEGKEKIAILIPKEGFKWDKFNQSKEANDKKMSELLPPTSSVKNPAELLMMETCKQSSDAYDQFLMALVYAFGSCLNFPECYLEPFGEGDQRKEMVWQAIQQAIIEKQMPTVENMWGAPL